MLAYELLFVDFVMALVVCVYDGSAQDDSLPATPFLLLAWLEVNEITTTTYSQRLLYIYPGILLFDLLLVIWRRRKLIQNVQVSTEATFGSLLHPPKNFFFKNAKEVEEMIIEWTTLPRVIATVVGTYLATPKTIHLERDDWTPFVGFQAQDFWLDPNEHEEKNKSRRKLLDPRYSLYGKSLSRLSLTPRIGRTGTIPELVFPVVSIQFPFDTSFLECIIDVWRLKGPPSPRPQGSGDDDGEEGRKKKNLIHDDDEVVVGVVMAKRCARNLHALASLRTILILRQREPHVQLESRSATIYALERSVLGSNSSPILKGKVLVELEEFERHALQEGVFKIIVSVPSPTLPNDAFCRVSGELTVVLGPCEWHKRDTVVVYTLPPLVLRHAVLNLV